MSLVPNGGAWIAANRISSMLESQKVDSRCLSLYRQNQPQLGGWIDKQIIDRSQAQSTLSLYRSSFINNKLLVETIADATHVNLHWLPGHIRETSLEILRDKKIVWTLHDMQPFTGICHHSNDCSNFESDCMACPQTAKPLQSKVKREIEYRRINYGNLDLQVISPSSWLANKARKSSVFHNIQIHTIPNPIDLTKFRHRTKIKPGGILRLGIIGSNAGPFKGTHVTSKYLNQIPTDLKLKIELCIIGEDYKNLPIFQKKLLPTGSANSEVLKFMSGIDVFLYLSLQENLPNLLVELQATGVPIIAVPNGGVSETFAPGKTGWTIESYEEFLEILLKIEKDRNYLRAHSEAALKFVAEKFSQEQIFQKYMDVYSTRKTE